MSGHRRNRHPALGVPDEPQFALPALGPVLQAAVLGVPLVSASASTPLSSLLQTADQMAPSAPQTDSHDGTSDIALEMFQSHSMTNSETPANESTNIGCQTDGLRGPAAVSTLSSLNQDFDEMASFAPQTNSHGGRSSLALDMHPSHSITNSGTQENEFLNLGLQTDELLGPAPVSPLRCPHQNLNQMASFAPHIALSGGSSGFALQSEQIHSLTTPNIQHDNHGLQADTLRAPSAFPTLDDLTRSAEEMGPLATCIALSGVSSGLALPDSQTCSLTSPPTSDTRFGSHGRHSNALLGPPVTLLTQSSLQQNLTNLATSENRFENHGLQLDTLPGPHATLPTLSSLDRNFDPTAAFTVQMNQYGGSSDLAMQSNGSLSTRNPAFTDTQFENRHTIPLHTLVSTYQLHEQPHNLEELPTDLLLIYEPARAHHIAMLPSHGPVSRSSVAPLADLRYESGTQDSRYIQEELFDPGAEDGHIPDYSRVQRRLFLVPAHKPPSDIYSERSSIVDSEGEDADSFGGLRHQDGLLPQPVRHSQMSIQGRSFPDGSPEQDFLATFVEPATSSHTGAPNPPLPDASFFDWAPGFVSRIEDWINGIIPLSITETTEAEHVHHGFTTNHTEEDAEVLFVKDDRIIVGSAASRSSFSTPFAFPPDVMDTGYLALTSALNNFHPWSQQSQNASNDATQAEVDQNRAEALALLTRGRSDPENPFSGSDNKEGHGPKQALERIQGSSRTQLQADADTRTLQDQNRYTVFDNFLENCREFIVYQLGSIERIPIMYTYRHGSERIRQRLQEHFGDEQIGYAMEVFRGIMEHHNPSVLIDEDNIYASWRYDYAHRNVSPFGVLSAILLCLKLT